MDDVNAAPLRGSASSTLREFTCKDCQRELDALRKQLVIATKKGDKRQAKQLTEKVAAKETSVSQYNEHWARNILERGGSRSDRCKEHRAKHRINTQGMAVAYIDITTVGEVADRQNPTGPLGGLGPLPDLHTEVPKTYDLMDANVGMTDEHAMQMIALLRDKRVLVLKAGTGTGKSTFAPYRLMDPPPASYANLPAGVPFAKLTDLGQIVVTEPRVQAAVGVAGYVGKVLAGAGAIGPGYPVGYQVSGDRNHDEACQLVYVTDGTMINWLREGRLSRIGTVIVDEAHERSVNIDFILGFLRRELDRYPHLRVIITSATFDASFYQEYFGGPDVAHVMDVPAVKSFGYGMPLFPELDGIADGEADAVTAWKDPELPLSGSNDPRPIDAFIRQHWKEQYAPPLPPDDVLPKHKDDTPEDVWQTTRTLLDLRYQGKIDIDAWTDEMPEAMASFIISLTQGLDDADIFGDILGFLPTTKQIEQVVDQIKAALGPPYGDDNVFPLISTLRADQQRKALAKRRKGDPRKIVISTNLAETSLTVEGVRFVVDSGVIAQSEWDPSIAQGGVRKKVHSQAGIRQRWGRVGRKAPGWVFPLYTKGQFLSLPQDTPPGSTRENLEALVMTARMGGVDDVEDFPWPASFEPTTSVLEPRARESQATFKTELSRADTALRAGGAVDADGHPTAFGKELSRFSSLGASSAMAVLYADRLGCVPEVATVLSLLGDNRLVGTEALLQDTYEWPDEWRLEAAASHRTLAGLAEDEAHLVLLVMAAWERADPDCPAWEPSPARQRWAARWWVNDAVLLAAATQRQEILSALSPAMKEEVKRAVEPALLDRTRGVLSRALHAQAYDPTGDAYTARMPVPAVIAADPSATASAPSEPTLARLEDKALVRPAGPVIALRRRIDGDLIRISGVLRVASWALPDTGPDGTAAIGTTDAMRLLVRGAERAAPDPSRNIALGLIETWPAGLRAEVRIEDGRLVECSNIIEPFVRPEKSDRKSSKRRRRRPAIDGTGQADRRDSQGDLNARRRDATDEDDDAARAFADADRQALAGGACQECFACRDGRPEDCDDPSGHAAAGRGRNPLHGWQERTAKQEAAVKAPQVLDVSDGSGQWVEVVGLEIIEGQPVVRLAPDWRPAGFRGNPAQHADLEPGRAVEVVVGPLLRDHSGEVRSFLRADGQGRFVLREATNPKAEVQETRREIASSLDRGASGLLAQLVEGRTITATVVPARFEGCLTVTLLEMQHQHLGKAVMGVGKLQHKLDRYKSIPTYLARVVAPADEWGWVHMALLHRDSFHGLEHLFRYRPGKPDEMADATKAPDGGGPVTGAPPAAGTGAGSALEAGQVVLLNLVRDNGELDCADLDLDALELIEKRSAGTLKVRVPERRSRGGRKDAVTAAEEAAQTADDEVDTAEVEPADLDAQDAPAGDSSEAALRRRAPMGTELRTTQDKPLSRAAALALEELSDEPGWANEVWSFWARSHHLRLDRKTPVVVDFDRPALDERTSRQLDVPAMVVVTETDPAQERRSKLADFAQRTAVGSTVMVTVSSLKGGAHVSTADGLPGFIAMEELSYKQVKNAATFVDVGTSLPVTFLGVDENRQRLTFSYRGAQDVAFQAMRQKVTPGTPVDAVVRTVAEKTVYVELEGGVSGEIALVELAYEVPASAKDVIVEGSALRAVVLDYDQDLRVVRLSVKALLPDPFEAFIATHPEGKVMNAPVRRVGKKILDLRLAEGVRGYVMSRDFSVGGVEDFSGLVSEGDVIRVRLIAHHKEKAEVQTSAHPFDLAGPRVEQGQPVELRVTKVTPGLVRGELADGVPAFVPRSELDHQAPADASEAVKVGQKLKAEVLEVDRSRREVKLSVKRLLPPPPPPYEAFKKAHAIGQQVTGTITNVVSSAAFVRLDRGTKGRIHVKQLARTYTEDPNTVVSKGQVVQAVIISFDETQQRVELSLTAPVTGAPPTATTPPAAPRTAPNAPTSTPTSAPPPAVVRPAAPPSNQPQPAAAAAAVSSWTFEGRSVQEAVTAGCAKLGLLKAQVHVEVVDDGDRGLFGRVKRMAKVRLTKR